jgi:hypothetical protein
MDFFVKPQVSTLLLRLYERVHGELMVKPLRKAEGAFGSEPANRCIPTWFAIWVHIKGPDTFMTRQARYL